MPRPSGKIKKHNNLFENRFQDKITTNQNKIGLQKNQIYWIQQKQ